MKSLYKCFLGTVFLIAIHSVVFAQSHGSVDHYSHLPDGGRRALHGMVVFGEGPYFLEHIPMLTPPHDFQIIAEVILLKNGIMLQSDFSHQGYTFKPDSSFSLNDYVAGRLKSFSGSIFQGSFEQNGSLISGLENITVEIKSYKLIRQLPGTETVESTIQISDGKNSFESNLISPLQNFQLIRNINTGKVLWCVKAPDFFDSCQ